ncbi:hypothetical protein AG1IA_03932 [Rhizoctonia solani AG-1 IA]|uniref:Uncharacterized protein n=1 Tax=Thanatephorus cucumeris (strain AG1-IA) TaxID=983506 RepID=L8WZ36_THACA|nr:hypothetical protein AG1IA_03932 [Rhizoctonia solani AG-1 IA]
MELRGRRWIWDGCDLRMGRRDQEPSVGVGCGCGRTGISTASKGVPCQNTRSLVEAT